MAATSGSKKMYPIIEHFERLTAKQSDSKACCNSTPLSLLTLKSTSQDIQLKQFVKIVKGCISNLLKFVPSFVLALDDTVKKDVLGRSYFPFLMASRANTFRETGTGASHRVIKENFHVDDNYGEIFVYLVFADLYLNKLIEKTTSYNSHDYDCDDSSEEYEERMEHPILLNMKQTLVEMSKILDAVFQSYQLGTGELPEPHIVKKIGNKAASNFARMKPYDIRNIFQTAVFGTQLELCPSDFIYCTLGLKTSSRQNDFSFGISRADPEIAILTRLTVQSNLDTSWWLWMIRNRCCSYSDDSDSDSDWKSDSELDSEDEIVVPSKAKTKGQKPEAAIPKLEEIFQEVGFTASRAALLESWIKQNRFNEHELLTYWTWKHVKDTFKYSILLNVQCPIFPYFEDSINVWQTVKVKRFTMMKQESSEPERASEAKEKERGAQKSEGASSSEIEIIKETKHLEEVEDKDAQRPAQQPDEAICSKEESKGGQSVETTEEAQQIAEEMVIRGKYGTQRPEGASNTKEEENAQQPEEATCGNGEQNRVPQAEGPNSVEAKEGAKQPDGTIWRKEDKKDAKQVERTGSGQEPEGERHQQRREEVAQGLQGSEKEDGCYGTEGSRISPLPSNRRKVWGSRASQAKRKSGKMKKKKKEKKKKGEGAMKVPEAKKTAVSEEETDSSETMDAEEVADEAVKIKVALEGCKVADGREAGSGREEKLVKESKDFDVPVINIFFTAGERCPTVKYSHGETFENELDCLWYHGTDHRDAVSIIKEGIKLERGGERKDFSDGNGFYLFATYEDAIDWARGIEGGMHAAVVVFKFEKEEFKGVKVGADAEWQHFVRYYRGKPLPGRFGRLQDVETGMLGPQPKILEDFDFIEGPMAKVRTGAELIKGEFQAFPTKQICIRSAKMAEQVGMLIDAVIFFSKKK